MDSSVSRNPSQPVLYRLVIPPLPLPILSHLLKLTKNQPPPQSCATPPNQKKTNITVIIYYVDLYTPPHPVPVSNKAYFRLLNDPSKNVVLTVILVVTSQHPICQGSPPSPLTPQAPQVVVPPWFLAQWHPGGKKTPGRPWFF